MTDVLLDTCAFAWSLQGPGKVSSAARNAISAASTVYLSPISIFEVTQKVRIGRWPAMAPMAPYLTALTLLKTFTMAPLDAAICSAAGSMAWSHKDPFDRMIAATALHLGCPVVSSDAAFDGVVARVW